MSALLDGLTPIRRHFFGSAAKAVRPEDVAETSLKVLAKSWNPHQDWTLLTSIGCEWQRYLNFGQNHQVMPDRLDLVGQLDRSTVRWTGGDFATIKGRITKRAGMTPGTPTPIGNLGLADMTGLEVGRLIVIQWRGLYRVTAVDAAAATVTMVPVCPQQDVLVGRPADTGTVLVLPGYALELAKPTVKGQPLVWVKDVPASMPASGMMIGYVDTYVPLQRNDDYRVTTINRAAKLLACHKPLTFGPRPTGSFILALAPITSGQIWSKEGFDLGKRTYAFELVVNLPKDARGSWCAGWLYAKNDNTSRIHPNVGDEIDLFEIYDDLLRGPDVYSGNTHRYGRTVADEYFVTDANWRREDMMGEAYRRGTEPLGGCDRRFLTIVEPGMIHRYLDGTLMKRTAYTWGNPRPAQLGLNMAIGSFGGSNAMNGMMPQSQADLDAARLGIKSVSIYAGPAA